MVCFITYTKALFRQSSMTISSHRDSYTIYRFTPLVCSIAYAKALFRQSSITISTQKRELTVLAKQPWSAFDYENKPLPTNPLLAFDYKNKPNKPLPAFDFENKPLSAFDYENKPFIVAKRTPILKTIQPSHQRQSFT